MKRGNGTVVEARVWKHPDGRTASVTGAYPGPGYEMKVVGWTIKWEDGSFGCGRPPWACKPDAELFVAVAKYRTAARVSDPRVRKDACAEAVRLILDEGARFPGWSEDSRDDFCTYALDHEIPEARKVVDVLGARVTC